MLPQHLHHEGTRHLVIRSCLLASGRPNTVFVSAEEPEVIGSHVPVTALVGQDVILQCQLEPPFDVHNLTVEWRFHKTIAHMYRSRGDDFDSQHERFRNRTVLFHDNMVTGDISLKLINVTEEDKGNYTCHVPNLQSQVRKAYITLNVGECSW
uniref:Ig-like domain-containing protein n=1 Tax=Stegastes partitus TaxID=144197 RepID=A0A3B5BF19_9TELE